MYKVTCDGYPLLDTRDDDYFLVKPRVKNEVNTVGEGSFSIYSDHPHYDKLTMLRSIFEVADEFGAIFRGRMTEHTRDIHNGKAVDLEGAMAYFNDSVVRPYSFPDDFLEDEAYIAAATSGNVVEFYLAMLINQHNAQVDEFQRFKLGRVTVADPNNYITRSETELPSTWEELSAKLFKSPLGGYLCIRYEADGNYIDYLAEFTEVNEQGITIDENLLDISQTADGTETYSAIIPRGAEIESEESTGNDYEGDYGTITDTTTVTKRLTLDDLPDGDITGDIAKVGDTLYSKSAVAAYGWRYAPREETLWEDVTEAENLLSNGVDYMSGAATKIPNTIKVTACDLHFEDATIRSFRIYKKIPVYTPTHGVSGDFDLTALDIDLLEPQNTKITAGKTITTFTAMQEKQAGKINEVVANLATKSQLEATKKATQVLIEKSEEVVLTRVATIEKEVGENGAAIALVVEDGEVRGDMLIEAINGESTARINADRLELEGKTLDIRVPATNIEGEVTAEQINAGGLEVLEGKIGGWTLGLMRVPINASSDVETYALRSEEMYNASTKESYRVYLTAEGVYMDGRDGLGATQYEHKSWLDIIRG